MDQSLFDILLRTAEGEILDVKEVQYDFGFGVKADDGLVTKGKYEFVKDILAFANAWRQQTAYILIGVKQAVPKHIVVGENSHPDEATLQQLVNGKTNRPIAFGYSTYNYEGKTVGVVEIPMQRRPFFLEKQFGPLQPRVVYVRRGSSTDEADPMEVHEMGEAVGLATAEARRVAEVELDAANVPARQVLAEFATLKGKRMPLSEVETLPDYVVNRGFLDSGAIFENRNYYRDAARYLNHENASWQLGFVVRNNGKIAAEDARLAIEVRTPTIQLVHPLDVPDVPRQDYLPIGTLPEILARQKSNLSLQPHNNGFRAVLNLGDVLPGEQRWLQELPFLECHETVTTTLDVALYAKNLPAPVRKTFTLRCEIEKVTREQFADAQIKNKSEDEDSLDA